MRIKQIAPGVHPLKLDLPWELPLDRWDIPEQVEMARGISRNVVRFIKLQEQVYAVKQISERLAVHEFKTLREMQEQGAPAVEPVALVTQRHGCDGMALLVTQYLKFAQPYRLLLTEKRWQRDYEILLDALVELLVWLHTEGIFWGDCSLSNTLFRDDAGRLAAWFVDAETAEIHPQLSRGQRQLDLQIAQTNLAGEIMDLQAGGYIDDALDPVLFSEMLLTKYQHLWSVLSEELIVGRAEQFKVDERLSRLHDLGYDVAEMELLPQSEGDCLKLVTRVVEPGYHIRQLGLLTGLKVQSNQARRLLNEIYYFKAKLNQVRKAKGLAELGEQVVAQRWFQQQYLPILSAIPDTYRNSIDDAELFHQFLEHRWYISEDEGEDVGTKRSLISFINNVLKPLEKTDNTKPGG